MLGRYDRAMRARQPVGRLTLLQQAISAIRRNNGALLYVPTNFAGAWTGSAGTDPVDSVTDVLGLMTDRSYGANNLGPELVDRSIGVIGSTYIIRGTSVDVGGGFYTVTGNNAVASAVASLDPLLTFGKYYRITIEIAAGSSGPVNLHLSGAQNSLVAPTPFFSQSTPGVYGVTVVMDTANRDTITGFCGATGISTTFKVSVREILGAVATQATTANKPTVQRPAANNVIRFDSSNDSLSINLASGGSPFVRSYTRTGTVSGFTSATTSAFELGQPTVAGRDVCAIVCAPSTITGADLTAIERWAASIGATL